MEINARKKKPSLFLERAFGKKPFLVLQPVRRRAVCVSCGSDDLNWNVRDDGARIITCRGCGKSASGDAAVELFRVVREGEEMALPVPTKEAPMSHKLCNTEGCKKIQVLEGLCSTHYRIEHGMSIAEARKRKTARENGSVKHADHPDQAIGVRIKAFRLSLGLNAAKFAKKAGISGSWLCRMEKGKGNVSAGVINKVLILADSAWAKYVRHGGALPECASPDLSPARRSADLADHRIKSLRSPELRACPSKPFTRVSEIEYGAEGKDEQTGRVCYFSIRMELHNGALIDAAHADLVRQVRERLDAEIPYLSDFKKSLQEECDVLAKQKKLLLRQIEGLNMAVDGGEVQK